MTTVSVAIGIIGAGIMGERMLNAILQQDPLAVHVSGIWDPSPAASRICRTCGKCGMRPK
jgi:predicted dehydrogenase